MTLVDWSNTTEQDKQAEKTQWDTFYWNGKHGKYGKVSDITNPSSTVEGVLSIKQKRITVQSYSKLNSAGRQKKHLSLSQNEKTHQKQKYKVNGRNRSV